MKKLLIALLFILGGFYGINAQDELLITPDDISIDYEKFVLENGLTLIVHEDHKAPIVAVNVWYHVGSKNEKPGKSGFAHLFEHLMFNGSENFNDDYFQALERIGGTDLNGTTNNDRTNYFQNVPKGSLDQVLWLESDRMGHLLGAIDQDKLDEQRGVVQNEKRQGENQPYGKQYDLLVKAMFPKGHPYSWTVIGEMEDLNAASLEDVQEWFKSYYGAANATLVVAGDITPEVALEKVKKYFGNIPAGPTMVVPQVNIPIRESDTREYYQDRVAEARVVKAWNTPPWGSKESAHLELAAMILSSGKNSRLYKNLIYDKQIATGAYAFNWEKELVSNFIIQANAKPGVNIYDLEKEIELILEDFIKNGPTQDELHRVKSDYFADYLKGLERIGGFGGKSDILAQNQVYGNDPSYYKTWLEYLKETSVEEIQKTAAKWLRNGSHTIICEPFPEYSVTGEEADRSGLPEVTEVSAIKFPELQTRELKNGLKIKLARREGVPTMVINMVLDAGYASDQFASPGTAKLAMNMMDEGTKNMSALEINDKLQRLGASVGAYSDLDNSYVTLNTLKPTLEESMKIFSDVLLNPAFPEKELERLKKQQIASIQREKTTPVQMALRVVPKYLYPENHAYHQPLTGSGYEETVNQLEREDMINFYNQWIRPNNATLVVVGDISMDELEDIVKENLSQWKKGDIPEKTLTEVNVEKSDVLYLMDRPESQQSVIFGAKLIPGYGEIDEIAANSMMDVYGGEFTSRLNMNLREDKHWAYGAFGFIQDSKGQRPFISYAPVQTDKTAESVTEIRKEMGGISGDKPVTNEELAKVINNTVLQLPGQWETNSAVASSLVDQVVYGLPEDYYSTYGDKVKGVKVDDVNQLARKIINKDQINWFIVGDKEKVMDELVEIGFKEIVVLDKDGNPVKPDSTTVKTEN
ncbi:pitrilysin family protein [Mangrovivirga sp. M17]|uniref:Pitrilysin family protein n=1 Tax=Mangrovivirga halotolerans TaxID=2993936 RepID=A0ABT3RQ90_9BACT|nr:pitrilysin family protein [Mangrovivirga halotolerans]MCX2743960.1 pitrilysin family protein [Mangrovivirga halotolerans]